MNRTLVQLSFFLLFPVMAFSQYFGEEVSPPSPWSVGIKTSVSMIDGDVKSLSFGKQGSLFFEKTLSRVVDMRIEAQIGQTQGQNLFASDNHSLNAALNGNISSQVFYDSSRKYFHNYQHTYASLGISFKLNLNRLIHVVGSENWDFYLLGGLGAYGYETRINALDESGEIYQFDWVNTSEASVIQDQLGNLMDNSYESLAEQDLLNNTYLGPYVLKTYFQGGAGIRFLLTKSLGIGLESNYLFFGDDLLDGQQWGEDGEMSLNRDKLLSLGLLLDVAF